MLLYHSVCITSSNPTAPIRESAHRYMGRNQGLVFFKRGRAGDVAEWTARPAWGTMIVETPT